MAKVNVGDTFKMSEKTVEDMKGAILKVTNSLWKSALYIDFVTGHVWWTCSMETWDKVPDQEIYAPVFRENHDHWLGSEDEVEVLATDIMIADIKKFTGDAKKVLTAYYGIE